MDMVHADGRTRNHSGYADTYALFVQYRDSQGQLRLRRDQVIKHPDGKSLKGPGGITSQSLVTDWDCDGLLDIVCHWGQINTRTQPMFVRNIGTKTEPRFDDPKAICLWGEPLKGLVKHGPYWGIHDIDEDGKPDLLAGFGYGNYTFYRRTALEMKKRPKIRIGTPLQQGSLTADLIEVDKVWDKATHNAFTDLLYWHGRFYCAFREAGGHVGTVGKVRIISSEDAKSWRSETVLDSSSPLLDNLVGWDIRDTHFSVTPDDRLMLVGGAYKKAAAGAFVGFTRGKDSNDWKKITPRKITDPPWWLWTAQWRGDTCWGFAYDKNRPAERKYIVNLLRSTDGINWKIHVPDVIAKGGRSSETAIRFDSEGNAYALNRRNDSSALLGKSSGGLKSWQWYDLGVKFSGFGGPNLIETPYGWIGGGRMHDGGSNMSLTSIDMENLGMRRILRLPSSGDCSYPGFVWHDNLLYVSYYSSHQGKASVYLAKVKLQRFNPITIVSSSSKSP